MICEITLSLGGPLLRSQGFEEIFDVRLFSHASVTELNTQHRKSANLVSQRSMCCETQPSAYSEHVVQQSFVYIKIDYIKINQRFVYRESLDQKPK